MREILEDSQEDHAMSSHYFILQSELGLKANTHTRDVRWKEEEDEGEEEWKSACKLLYVSGFNPCRLQLSANTINPQRRWREGKRRRQAS